jgi:hypothetical protein
MLRSWFRKCTERSHDPEVPIHAGRHPDLRCPRHWQAQGVCGALLARLSPQMAMFATSLAGIAA